MIQKRLRWSRGSVLAFSTQVRGPKQSDFKGEKVLSTPSFGTSKREGKQWQTTPKNLPRMQRTRAIPVA